MKMLLSVVAVAGLTVSCDFHQHVHALMAQDSGAPKSAAAAVAGMWQLSMQTPHGPMNAGMQVKQDGTKINGTCNTDHTGTVTLAGTVDGKRISFSMEIPGGPKITFSGTVEGNKMGGTTDFEGGAWSAARAPKDL
ncbi:MAG: hypothetical protein NTW28_13535 [Candidatus Solibacter sp.]|nr:hypothetical protein [Candidatus Solibacter sp.]